ncbi:fungal-specific transcription factor domain-containing protein [Dioszegia hungarica]|uniref:Fungal-specific transcription factor domain-containing protein n=1 Tax=Dioszegia hungarica TaxID=4972 RepID=A0AA38H741_9TREE|nr:fungal-specific transcription factor domain-containing protein [Dioszegia hungarica]KAI9633949.1 fungal-specific transcription factor domain-containing protein [Dioszegia hungarica]
MDPRTFDPRRGAPFSSGSLPGPSVLQLPAAPKKKRASQSAPTHAAIESSPPGFDGPPDLTKVRAYAACKSCRLKKIKCLPGPSAPSKGGDANGPPGPCQQCTQASLECTYPPTRDRAAYSRQYVQNLESRVQALEVVNARLLPMLDAFERGEGMELKVMQNGEGAGERYGYPHQEPTGYHPAQADDGDDDPDADGDEFDHEHNNGQMTQDERGNYRWIGASNTLSLLDSFNPTSPHQRPEPLPGRQPTSGDNPYFAPVAGSGVINVLPTVDEVVYPEARAAEEMIDAYFREIHPILPIMIEREFREAYAALMQRRSAGVLEKSGMFVSMVFAIFALGERVIVTSRAWKREKQKQKASPGDEAKRESDEETVLPGEAEAGVIWYERSQILRYTSITDISLNQIQALILMAAFQASVNAMPMSWLLCGIALRMAQDLGLHRSAARLKLSFADKQVRSRCWWSAYGLDRMVSLTLGRPPGVDDLDIDVPYPAELDDDTLLSLSASGESSAGHSPVPAESQPSTMSGFVALTKLCKISGKISHILYRPSQGRSADDPGFLSAQQTSIDKLDKALRDWLAHEVSPKYKDQSQDSAIQLVSAALSNTYFACLITLHRNFLPPSLDSGRPRPLPSSTSLSHCVAAARSVIHIAAQSRVLLPPSHHLAVFCQYLWSAAVMLLLCEVQAKDQVVVDAVGPQVDSCRRSLKALEPVWPGAKKLKELLDEAERRGKEVVKSGMDRSSKKRRKSSHPEGGSSSKRPSLHPAGDKRYFSSTGYGSPPITSASAPWGALQAQRSPMSARPGSAHAYETSDTRTALPERSRSYQNRPGSAGISYPHQPQSQSGYTTISPTDFLQPVNYTFDVGGVDFDGLEMLQGFNNDFASLWQTVIPDTSFTSNPMPSAGPSQQPQMSLLSDAGPTIGAVAGQGQTVPSTPNLADGNSGWVQSSPQVGTGTGTGYTMGQGQQGNEFGVLTDLGTSEFWSQIAAAGQDWGADPNLPFNF